MPTIRERMETKLTQAFSPVSLVIKDDSHRHAGHADRIAALKDKGLGDGHAPVDEGGETHFRVEIVSASFTGQTRVARQRMVFDVLKEELAERIHALQISAKTPEEAGV